MNRRKKLTINIDEDMPQEEPIEQIIKNEFPDIAMTDMYSRENGLGLIDANEEVDLSYQWFVIINIGLIS
jgi:hypothetical protein